MNFVEEKLDFQLGTDGIVGMCVDDPKAMPEFPHTQPNVRTRPLFTRMPDPGQNPNHYHIALVPTIHKVFVYTAAGGRTNRYQFSLRLRDHPFGLPAPPFYRVLFQWKFPGDLTWTTFKEKPLSTVLGSRVSVFRQAPSVNGSMKLTQTQYRMRVLDPAGSQGAASYSCSLWK